MTQGDAARLYHRLTSYSPDREWTDPVDDPRGRHDLVPNDPATLPPPVKRYAGELPVTPLPRDLPPTPIAATDVLAGVVPAATASPDLGAVARLLYLSAGVVRAAERDGRRMLFRAAGSAGNRFPLEVYLAARGIAGLADGVHWYDPEAHALRQVGPAPAGEVSTIVVTGVPWRTGWRYAERGYRHLYWDAGTLLAQQSALAASAGVPALLRTVFPDRQVTELVGADGVHEFPLVLLTFGEGVPAIVPGGPAATGEIGTDPPEFGLLTATQRAGDGEMLGDPWPAGEPLAGEPPASAPLDDVILRRGSTRRMDPEATVGPSVLDWGLAAATRGIPYPQYVVVHGVDGREPGVYAWPDLHTPRKAGDLRAELRRICLDQGLGGDAAYVVISAADLRGLDDRGYRDTQLAAGLVEGRLHLAAYALGAGASGMTFLDSEIPGLLGTADAATLFTCVGVPAYRSRPGAATPGEPVEFRVVTPR
jgi:SagB-type dehydrogenase family enzyme